MFSIQTWVGYQDHANWLWRHTHRGIPGHIRDSPAQASQCTAGARPSSPGQTAGVWPLTPWWRSSRSRCGIWWSPWTCREWLSCVWSPVWASSGDSWTCRPPDLEDDDGFGDWRKGGKKEKKGMRENKTYTMSSYTHTHTHTLTTVLFLTHTQTDASCRALKNIHICVRHVCAYVCECTSSAVTMAMTLTPCSQTICQKSAQVLASGPWVAM